MPMRTVGWSRACRLRCRGQGLRAARQFDHARQVHLRGDPAAEPGHPLRRVVEFGAGRQSEVALVQAEGGFVRQCAEHRHIGVVLDHGAQLGLVPAATHLVEYHPGDADALVEGLEAEDQRRDAACHATRVDDQQHGQAEHVRQRRIAVAAVQRHAVVQALVAFDDADVGAFGMPREGGGDLIAARQVGVEVEAVAPGGLGQPHRVDVVGPLLEGLHRQTLRTQGRTQADAERGLARGLVRGRNQQPCRVHAGPLASAFKATKSSCGMKSSTRTPMVVSTKAAPTPPRPSSHSGSLGT
jgi:hypothetical protein